MLHIEDHLRSDCGEAAPFPAEPQHLSLSLSLCVYLPSIADKRANKPFMKLPWRSDNSGISCASNYISSRTYNHPGLA